MLRRALTPAKAFAQGVAGPSRPRSVPTLPVLRNEARIVSCRSASHKANTDTNPAPVRLPKGKLPSHKPPKRRMEAASQPLRQSQSATRGPVLQCIAHTTAERYDLASLAHVLKGLGVRWDEVPEGDRDRAFVIGPWKGRGGVERIVSGKDVGRTTQSPPRSISTDQATSMWSIQQLQAEAGEAVQEEGETWEPGFGYGERGEIWVFGNGSFVTWGLTESEGESFLREVIRRKGAGVERGSMTRGEYEVEEVDFVVDPTAQTHIMGNLILLGASPTLSTFHHSLSLGSLLTRYTLSLALTRSSSLSVLEDRLDSHITSVSSLPLLLSRSGAQPMSRREIIRKIGDLMSLRMAVNTSGGGLDDTPEFYWSEPALEEYFDAVTTEFEIKERIESINRKIDYASEVQSTLRALLTEASGHRMELIIIALIAVEVIVVLIREGPELWEKLVEPGVGKVARALGIKWEEVDHALVEEELELERMLRRAGRNTGHGFEEMKPGAIYREMAAANAPWGSGDVRLV